MQPVDAATINRDVELRRRTWLAALQLAAIISLVAVLIAIAASALGDVPQAAVVLPVIVGAFVASWIRTGRVQREFSAPTAISPRYSAPIA